MTFDNYEDFFSEWVFGDDSNIPVKCYWDKSDSSGQVHFAQTRRNLVVCVAINKITKKALSIWWEKAKSMRDEEMVIL